MGDYEITNSRQDLTLPMKSQNGGFGGHVNPAFRVSGPVAISPGLLNGDFFTENHLIYRTSQKSKEGSRDTHNFFGSSLDNKYLNKYATTRHPPSTIYSPRGLEPNGNFGGWHTIGRNSAPMYRTNTIGYSRRPGAHTMRRQAAERKEACVSFFDIETDKVSSYQYRPGEEITGVIKIIVRQNMEIRFVELVVKGQGLATLKKSRDGLPKTKRETYLHKQTYVIGSGDAAWSSVLTPGHYTSKFRIKLPSGLPSTTHHDDANNGFTFDITYSLKARICDSVGHSSSRSTGSHHGFVKVLLAKQVNFNIQRGFDLTDVPGAMSPIIHTEQVHLSCLHQEAAIVCVSLDRSVFLAGDDVRLKLQVSLPPSQRVKDITCCLQEHVTFEPKQQPITFTLSRMIRKDLHHMGQRSANQSQEDNVYEVTIPTQTDLISPYSLGASEIKVEYSLAVILRFSPAGGKLSFQVPLSIGPCAEPIYAEKIASRKVVPVFNRTTRFPCFSSPTPPSTVSTPTPMNMENSSSSNVKTKYSNNCFSRCLLCCFRVTSDD